MVTAARGGDSHALGLVYELLAPRVLAYLRAKGTEDPESLTSEVFLSVIPRLPDIVGGAAGLRTLVFTVAHARVVDEARRRSRRPAHTPYDVEIDDRRADSAESTALERVATEDAMRMLDELGEEQRAVIMMRVLGDLTLEQTARALGKSTGAVKQLQRRGLTALRSMLERGEVGA